MLQTTEGPQGLHSGCSVLHPAEAAPFTRERIPASDQGCTELKHDEAPKLESPLHSHGLLVDSPAFGKRHGSIINQYLVLTHTA